jgi:uncharacterized protein (TIGR00255 family)
MTGFARADAQSGAVRWHWEVRSVNGRGLDIRLRLPPGLEAIEQRAREAVQRRFTRGSLGLTLTVQRSAGAAEIRLNEAALAQVLRAAERVRSLTGAPPALVEGLLAIRGVLEFAEPDDSGAEALHEAMLASLDEALSGVGRARATEGARLAAIVQDQLSSIERLTEEITNSPVRRPEAIRRRIAEQIARLTESHSALDPDRLHQEAVLVAQRADVEEELKRLTAHVAAARDLLSAKEPVGRRLDFLAQEFNREANTLCSKANDTEIVRIGLALRTVIDQMREQVQNIE